MRRFSKVILDGRMFSSESNVGQVASEEERLNMVGGLLPLCCWVEVSFWFYFCVLCELSQNPEEEKQKKKKVT